MTFLVNPQTGVKVGIRFAQGPDEDVLQDILQEHTLSLAGEIERHVVVTDPDGQVLGGGMVSLLDEDTFHLEVLGIKAQQCGQGLGDVLLGELLRDPWYYACWANIARHVPETQCARHVSEANIARRGYKMTTVSRGKAMRLYKSHGFQACTFLELPPQHVKQCSICPDRDYCGPVPMVLLREEG